MILVFCCNKQSNAGTNDSMANEEKTTTTTMNTNNNNNNNNFLSIFGQDQQPSGQLQRKNELSKQHTNKMYYYEKSERKLTVIQKQSSLGKSACDIQQAHHSFYA
jgi:hypothetical protein